MIFLLLSILVSTVIFIIFKLIGQQKEQIFQVIVINYIIAAITSFILLPVTGTSFHNNFHLPVLIMASIIGILFIVCFMCWVLQPDIPVL